MQTRSYEVLMEKMETSLKVAINRMMLVTLLLVSLVTCSFIFCYSQVKQTLTNRSLQEDLERNTSAQIEALLPSFLVPEQKQGIPELLERFKRQDELESIQVLEKDTDFPAGFSNCFKRAQSESCMSDDKTRVAVLFPIRESGYGYGYLLKIKKIENPFLHDHILLALEVGAGVLVLSFLLLFLFVGRLTSQELPSEISNLLSWLERVLSEQTPTKMPQLKFRELNELGQKAAELIERQNRVRDQATVGQLSSGIMHDIRTPMQSIVAAMYLAQEQPFGSPKRLSRLENLLNVCLNKVPGIGDLIESTLDVNRSIHVVPQKKDIQVTLSDVLEQHREYARTKNTKITADLTENAVVVNHDPVQLSRVFANIVRNAVEALPTNPSELSPEGNQIYVSVRKVDSEKIRIVFEDSGSGLPENIESIFRVFRSSKAKGSGLGLVISRKIVESHHGKLLAARGESLPGARFEVVLPI